MLRTVANPRSKEACLSFFKTFATRAMNRQSKKAWLKSDKNRLIIFRKAIRPRCKKPFSMHNGAKKKLQVPFEFTTLRLQFHVIFSKPLIHHWRQIICEIAAAFKSFYLSFYIWAIFLPVVSSIPTMETTHKRLRVFWNISKMEFQNGYTYWKSNFNSLLSKCWKFLTSAFENGALPALLKFVYSEKARKFCEISTLPLTGTA